MAGGRTVTAAVAERLAETLDAALVDPGAAQLLRGGRLTSALRHVGFGVVDETGQPADRRGQGRRGPHDPVETCPCRQEAGPRSSDR
jgi:hypothetical protein